MKLTEAEERIITSAAMVSPGFPYDWLKPQSRRAAQRLRMKGLLRKREFFEHLRLTAAGMEAFKRIGAE